VKSFGSATLTLDVLIGEACLGREKEYLVCDLVHPEQLFHEGPVAVSGGQVKRRLALLVLEDQLGLLVVAEKEVSDVRAAQHGGQVQRAVPLHVTLAQQALQQPATGAEMLQQLLPEAI